MNTIKIPLKRWLTAILMVMGCFLQPTAQAQDHSSKRPTNSYFLDNFKGSVDVGSSLSIKAMGKPWSASLQGGLSFGYYILKYDHTQRGIVKKDILDYKHVSIDTGKGLVSVEMGIRYPERRFIESIDALPIEEKLIVLPITIQWARPDFFTGGAYNTFFLSYNIKCLLTSAYTSEKENENLPAISTSGINTFFHSIILGTGFLVPFGAYLDFGLDIPLSPSNCLSKYEDAHSNSDQIDSLADGYRFLIRLGIDITMLIRMCHGMSFNNQDPRIRALH